MFLSVCIGLQFLILLRVAVDLAPMSWNNPLFRLVFETSEPLLKPFQRHARLPLLGWVKLGPLFAGLALLIFEVALLLLRFKL